MKQTRLSEFVKFIPNTCCNTDDSMEKHCLPTLNVSPNYRHNIQVKSLRMETCY